MKIIGIDTSTGRLCLGVGDGTKVCEYDLQVGRRLSQLLHPTIERVVRCLGWKLGDIDYFACGIGPGSFTGVRVAVATIKGLSWALDVPIVPIPSLDIIAMNYVGKTRYIACLCDAKRSLVYWTAYVSSQTGIKRLMPYALSSPEEAVRKIRAKIPASARKQLAIIGDGVGMYHEALRASLGEAQLVDKDYARPQGRNLIALAHASIIRKKTCDSFAIEPLYLYPKECQIRTPGQSSQG